MGPEWRPTAALSAGPAERDLRGVRSARHREQLRVHRAPSRTARAPGFLQALSGPWATIAVGAAAVEGQRWRGRTRREGAAEARIDSRQRRTPGEQRPGVGRVGPGAAAVAGATGTWAVPGRAGGQPPGPRGRTGPQPAPGRAGDCPREERLEPVRI